jgi:hypothetical protein
MQKFFNAFPITPNADKLAEAAQRLVKIDALLDIGRRLLTQVRDRRRVQFNIPAAKFRESRKFATKHRKKRKPRSDRHAPFIRSQTAPRPPRL